MVQSPSWEANWIAGSQEIPRISRNPKVHYRTHKRPPPVSILGQPNPVHIPTSHLLEIHPNIIHPSTPRSPQWSLSLRFPHQDPIHPPLLTHTRHMPSPSHSSRFYHPHNIGWGVPSNNFVYAWKQIFVFQAEYNFRNYSSQGLAPFNAPESRTQSAWCSGTVHADTLSSRPVGWPGLRCEWHDWSPHVCWLSLDNWYHQTAMPFTWLSRSWVSRHELWNLKLSFIAFITYFPLVRFRY